MTTMRKTRSLVLATFAAICAAATTTNAQTCAPPPGFVDMPHPIVEAPAHLVAHTEEVTVAHSLAQVLEINAKVTLKDAIHKADSLPGVTGEYSLGKIPFPAPGARRLVCLSDGSTLQEQSLEEEHTNTFYRFRYIVWHYTSPQARPIEYGVGEFRDSQIDASHTHIVWTYSFRLKDDRFPGYFGAFGRYLFRVGFLDRGYAAMMRATLHGD
jgi:hypothetical protein